MPRQLLVTIMMLKDKVALVTGGASGIGRATALAKLNEVIAFANAGAKVVFSDIHDAEAEKTAALIRDTGAECLFVRSDVSSEADVQALVQKAVATYGKLDCAFNNAGIDLAVKPLHEQSIENFDQIVSINARGIFLYPVTVYSKSRRVVTDGIYESSRINCVW